MESSTTVDIARLRSWWVSHASELPEEVVGIWFGLFEEISADGSKRFTMYVSGTNSFAVDEDGDWATEYVWSPLKRYLPIEFGSSDWEVVLAHATAVDYCA